VAVLACGALACHNDRPNERPTAKRPVLRSCSTRLPSGRRDRPTRVTLWHAESGDRARALRRLVSEFDDAAPGVVVEVEEVAGGRSNLLDRWRSADPADRPSIVLLPEDATRLLADSRQTVALGRCFTEAVPDALPVIEASWSVDGVVQAMPFAVSTPVLLYDRQAFRDARLDPDRPPATLAELRKTAVQLVRARVVQVGLLFDTGPDGGGSWFVEQWAAQVGALTLGPANGRRRRATRARWADGPTVDHLRWLRDMVGDGLAQSVGSNVQGLDDLRSLYADPPKAAMAVHTSGALGELNAIEAAAGGRDLDLGVAPLPGPGTGSLPGGVALWLAAGKPDRETRAAWSLAAFLGSPPIQSRWAATTGYVPTSRSAAEAEPVRSAWRAHPELEVAYDALADQGTSAAELGMSVGPEQEVEELLADAVTAAALGADPAKALATAATDCNRLLAAYNRGLP
jgi:sn-glycerol 3-phosphate transport system substrate-binding protein